MKKLIMPIVFLGAGLGAGIAAGVVLSPSKPDMAKVEAKPDEKSDKSSPKEKEAKPKETKAKDDEKKPEYLKLKKPFIVPVVEADKIAAMVSVSLSLEAKYGTSDLFHAVEPKLRDAFLQVLFDHANIGGFNGNFTESDNLKVMRKSLLDVARKTLGDDVHEVLIVSVNRQDT